MKKLVMIAIALVTLNGFAQREGRKGMDQENRSELRKDMSPEDIADLKSKKLTLKLDLTDKQQKEVKAVFLEQAKDREKHRNERKAKDGEQKEKPTTEEFVKMQNERLDKQIQMKRKMKSILTAEQYAEFEKMKPKKHKKGGKERRKGNKDEK
ncbi:hypothetical protein [Winogradskyella endarachnes]|uniref:DUF4890 domain-containing protein n=1 Tax=Winogradskyella endarachnes TaxID=2681965 RepID=A0A6L6U9A7_9FLAO|nr:hypothetical protein [Winogradskyella endarachnes]MUU78911.1 hypothetical protein [Winogradskyella endarachnes]